MGILKKVCLPLQNPNRLSSDLVFHIRNRCANRAGRTFNCTFLPSSSSPHQQSFCPDEITVLKAFRQFFLDPEALSPQAPHHVIQVELFKILSSCRLFLKREYASNSNFFVSSVKAEFRNDNDTVFHALCMVTSAVPIDWNGVLWTDKNISLSLSNT